MQPAIVERFLRHATERPGADAVVTPERRLSYDGLRRAAGRLQERLDRTPADGPVAILDRDAPERAVAVLAATASGRPFVLLDPTRDPASLLAAADAIGARIAIGSCGPVGFAHHLVTEDGSRSASGIELRPLPLSLDHPHHYVSTSGSTAEPRYVLRTHAAVLNRPGSHRVLGAEDRAFRPFNHSGPSLSELLDTLVSGATHLSAHPLHLSPSRVLGFLRDERATTIGATPTMLRLLFGSDAAGEQAPLPALRSVGGGGEPLLWADVPALRALGPADCVVRHGYASTETRAITSRIIPASEPLGDGAVPVGRPVPGRRVWIDAGEGRPAGPGQVGTVVVEGRFGTLGPDFERLPDGILRFRTGDLGELDHSGELHHRGRADGVVKIGAVRIDPAAVETVLRGVEGVRDARVVPATVAGGVRLVAHVHAAAEARLDAETLRRHASRVLVSGAVPSRIVLHDQPLPVLASGKLDLRSLQHSIDRHGPGRDER